MKRREHDVSRNMGEQKNVETIIRVKLPGFSREKVVVEIVDNALYVRAGHTEQTKVQDAMRYHLYQADRKVEKVFPFPADGQAEKTRATYKNETITIYIPRQQPGGSLQRNKNRRSHTIRVKVE